MAMSTRKIRSIALFIAVNLLSVVFLLWVLLAVDFRRLWHEVEHLHWGWVSTAVFANLLSYVIQAWRWNLVLAPVAPVPLWRSIQAIYVGLFANEVLPLRSGEIIRCYLQAKWTEIPLSVTLASALIERIFDGIWLIVGLLVTLQKVHLPGVIRYAGMFLALLILVAGALLAVAMYWREQTLDALLNARWFSWVHILIKDLHLIGHSRYLYFAFFASLPFFLLQIVPIYAVFRAYDGLNHFPVIASLTLAVILRLNSVLPQAPGNIGTFNAATVLALRLFRADAFLPQGPQLPGRRRLRVSPFEEMARGFSLILWAIMTLPLLIAGLFAVIFTGITIGELHRGARSSIQDRDRVTVTPDDAV
jgi:glycosyltransferase 2 family protein